MIAVVCTRNMNASCGLSWLTVGVGGKLVADSHKLESDVKLAFAFAFEASRFRPGSQLNSQGALYSKWGTGHEKMEPGGTPTRWGGRGQGVYGPRPSCCAEDTTTWQGGDHSITTVTAMTCRLPSRYSCVRNMGPCSNTPWEDAPA